MTSNEKKQPDNRPEVDKFGMGANEKGEVQILTPEQYAQRVIERNAEEAVDGDAPSDAGA